MTDERDGSCTCSTWFESVTDSRAKCAYVSSTGVCPHGNPTHCLDNSGTYFVSTPVPLLVAQAFQPTINHQVGSAAMGQL